MQRTSSAIASSTGLTDRMVGLQFIRDTGAPIGHSMAAPVIPLPFRHLLSRVGANWMLWFILGIVVARSGPSEWLQGPPAYKSSQSRVCMSAFLQTCQVGMKCDGKKATQNPFLSIILFYLTRELSQYKFKDSEIFLHGLASELIYILLHKSYFFPLFDDNGQWKWRNKRKLTKQST